MVALVYVCSLLEHALRNILQHVFEDLEKRLSRYHDEHNERCSTLPNVVVTTTFRSVTPSHRLFIAFVVPSATHPTVFFFSLSPKFDIASCALHRRQG